MKKVKITTEYIKLDQLLKFASITTSGGEGKDAILSGQVLVNGEVCQMRGKKIRSGDKVEYVGQTVEVE